LLLPALARAKEAARSARCKSNLRQWGVAFRLYVDDYRGGYPIYSMVPPGTNLWFDGLRAYNVVWTNGVAKCPNYKGVTIEAVPWSDLRMIWAVGSYAYNACGTDSLYGGGHAYSAGDSAPPTRLGLGGTWRGLKPTGWPMIWLPGATPESSIVSPANMICTGDSRVRKQGVGEPVITLQGANWFAPETPSSTLYSPYETDLERHAGGRNVVFCDGHVESLKRKRLFAPVETVRRRWNTDNQPHPETWGENR
jgi:prepilin-type processing-associated H-X9-DG protein